jgi:hypothetical protein
MIGRAAGLAVLLAAAPLACIGTPAGAQIEGDASVFTEIPTPVIWEDLMPEGEEERLSQMYMTLAEAAKAIDEGSQDDQMSQVGTLNVVEELDGLYVRIPGYVVPLDWLPGGSFSRFLLVPYYGACIHVPPPPPNQMIYVETDEHQKLDDPLGAVWIEGILSTTAHAHDYGEAAYTLSLKRMTPY